MERKGQNAAKVLILVPFITVLICMMIIPVWLSGIVTLMGSSFQYVWWLFLLCAVNYYPQLISGAMAKMKISVRRVSKVSTQVMTSLAR